MSDIPILTGLPYMRHFMDRGPEWYAPLFEQTLEQLPDEIAMATRNKESTDKGELPAGAE